MGGRPLENYLERGFEMHSQWFDEELAKVVEEKNILSETSSIPEAAIVGCCVKCFR